MTSRAGEDLQHVPLPSGVGAKAMFSVVIRQYTNPTRQRGPRWRVGFVYCRITTLNIAFAPTPLGRGTCCKSSPAREVIAGRPIPMPRTPQEKMLHNVPSAPN